eukprot:Colp12_sorted_trinity150504_noHs@2302
MTKRTSHIGLYDFEVKHESTTESPFKRAANYIQQWSHKFRPSGDRQFSETAESFHARQPDYIDSNQQELAEDRMAHHVRGATAPFPGSTHGNSHSVGYSFAPEQDAPQYHYQHMQPSYRAQNVQHDSYYRQQQPPMHHAHQPQYAPQQHHAPEHAFHGQRFPVGHYGFNGMSEHEIANHHQQMRSRNSSELCLEKAHLPSFQLSLQPPAISRESLPDAEMTDVMEPLQFTRVAQPSRGITCSSDTNIPLHRSNGADPLLRSRSFEHTSTQSPHMAGQLQQQRSFPPSFPMGGISYESMSTLGVGSSSRYLSRADSRDSGFTATTHSSHSHSFFPSDASLGESSLKRSFPTNIHHSLSSASSPTFKRSPPFKLTCRSSDAVYDHNRYAQNGDSGTVSVASSVTNMEEASRLYSLLEAEQSQSSVEQLDHSGTSYKRTPNRRKSGTKKVHACEYCGRIFSFADRLQNHVRTHTGERPFACTHPGCQARFAESSTLYKHMKTHQDIKPFHCDICNKDFRLRHHIQRHMRSRHPEAVLNGDTASNDSAAQEEPTAAEETMSGDD